MAGASSMRGSRREPEKVDVEEIKQANKKGLPAGYVVRNGKIVKEDGSGRQNKMLVAKHDESGNVNEKHLELKQKRISGG